MDLHFNGATLPESAVKRLTKEAKALNVPPSYLITKLHYEGLWGDSEVARLNNNLAGMTWTGDPNRPSGVKVEKGSARPAREGGHYMKYASLDDFYTDWLYLIRRGGSYQVADSYSFSGAVRGMFKAGGARYDYATMNVDSSEERYSKYLAGMEARREAINQANNGALDELDKKGEISMTTANQVLDQAKRMLGVTQRSSTHQALVNEYNGIRPNLQRNGGGHYSATLGDDWCDIFVTVVFKRAGGLNLIGPECGVQHHKNHFRKLGIWRGVVKPHPGDVIVYDWQGRGSGWADHIGIVEKFDGTYVHTIEGNVGNPPRKVGRKKYRYNANFVEGYARPRYGIAGGVSQQAGKDNKTVAAEVAAGIWENGDARRTALEGKGYNYNEIQKGTNLLFSWKGKPVDFLADKVIEGYFSVGEVREKALTAIGANYNQVQGRVTEKVNNRELTKKPLKEVAKDVWDGKYGNNPERAKKLSDDGYTAEEIQEIQKLVNQMATEENSGATEEVLVETEKQTGNEGSDLADNEVILDGVRYRIEKV